MANEQKKSISKERPETILRQYLEGQIKITALKIGLKNVLNTVGEIKKLPHYREFTCLNCGLTQKVYVLVIHGKCEHCGVEYKFRGIGPIGSELEDVIDAVLEWLGQGSEFDNAMKWKQVIGSDRK